MLSGDQRRDDAAPQFLQVEGKRVEHGAAEVEPLAFERWQEERCRGCQALLGDDPPIPGDADDVACAAV